MARNVEEIVLQARDEASQVIAGVAGHLGGVGEALRRLATSAGPVGLGLGAVAAGAAGIVLAGAKIADTVEQLDLLAARSGVGVERLQVLQQQIEEAGGDSGGLAQALSFLNRAIAQGDPLLKKLGITTRDTFEAFMRLAEVFGSSSDTAKKTEIAYQLLGRGAGDLVALLPKLRTEFSQTDAAMRASGALIGEDVAAQARKLDEDMDKLARNWKGAVTRIQSDTVPWALQIVRAFNDVWDAMTGRKKTPAEAASRQADEIQATIDANLADISRLKFEDRGGSNARFIKEREELIAKLQLQLGKLKGLRAETEAEEADLSAAFDRAGTGAAGDALAGVDVGAPNQALLDREERLKELMRVMGVTRGEAVQLAAALDRLDDASKKAELTKKLTFGPEVPKELETYNAQLDEMTRLFSVSGGEAAFLVDQVQRLNDAAKKETLTKQLTFGPEVPAEGIKTPLSVAEDWKTALDEILTGAALVDAAFGAVFSGLTGGWQEVFGQIAAGTATLGSTMKALWHGTVNAILAELGRVMAALTILGIGELLGIPGLSAIGGKALGLATGSKAMAPAGGGGGNTFNVYGYDVRDTVRDLTSMDGKQRMGATKVAIVGEF